MRRLTQRRLRTYYLRKRSVTKDEEGVPVESWGMGAMVQGEVWPARSRRQVEQYGDRVSGIQNMRIEGTHSIVAENGREAVRFTELGFTLSLGDGVCVHVSGSKKPDYRVLSITGYNPLLLEIERNG